MSIWIKWHFLKFKGNNLDFHETLIFLYGYSGYDAKKLENHRAETYLPIYLPTYLHTNLPTYQPTYLQKHLKTKTIPVPVISGPDDWSRFRFYFGLGSGSGLVAL